MNSEYTEGLAAIIIASVVLALIALSGCISWFVVDHLRVGKKDNSRSCVIVSTNVTLIPAKPNTVTILRNGTKETCYIYKETPNANLPN